MKKTSQIRAVQTCSPGEITLLLSDKNNPELLRNVIQLAHRELHRIATGLSHRPYGRTWQPTALLNEACLRLIEGECKAQARGTGFKNHHHFFAAASRAMRRVLVDEARKRQAIKRGGRWTRAEFTEAELIGFDQPEDVLDFHAALRRLEKMRPDLGEIVNLRVFSELTTTEVATILGISEATVRRRWSGAKRQLAAILSEPAGAGSE